MFLPKSKKRGMTKAQANAIIERSKTEAPLELEKGDMPAIILAAFAVFGPFVLGFGGALFLMYLFITALWG